MYRDDQEAARQQLDALQREVTALRADNSAMREVVLGGPSAKSAIGRLNVYESPVESLSAGERAALAIHTVSPFPVWLAALLHVVTLGLFSIFHFNAVHDRLPRAQSDDPTATRGAWFSFIPYFHFYWMVFNARRLVDRLNLQFRLRGERDAVSRDYATFAAVLGTIPYVNMTVGLFAWFFGVIAMQRAVNRVAAMGPLGEEPATRVDVSENSTSDNGATIEAEGASERLTSQSR